jgi:hydroxysqualene synthase
VVDLQAAYASCARLARAHYENFPVASILLPRGMRDHVAAIYAFARVADDFADEGDRPPSERLRLLESWQSRLAAAAAGRSEPAPLLPGEPSETTAIFQALGHSMRVMSLPVDLFEDLLSAFRQDVTVSHYDSWAKLLDYCRRSANPIGRLVLRVAGYDDTRLDVWSDSICTALQLTNFWQDAAIDDLKGRRYVPSDVPGRSHQDTMRGAWRRTRALFDQGRPLCDAVTGRLRYELRITWLCGVRILDRLEAGADRPRLGITDVPPIAFRMVTW